MPVNKICTHPACDEFALPDQTRCTAHIGEQKQAKAARWRAAFATDHGRAARALYNLAAWRNGRLAFLRRNPLCVSCSADGLVVAATDVDHIVPHRGNKALFLDRCNWQSLCHSCHSRKTASETLNRGVGQNPD